MNEKDKKILLSLAKNTIAKSLDLPYKEVYASMINDKRGAFVTLKENGQLRGCIGNIIGTKPLYQQIINLSLEAAYEDYRFQPLTKEEFPLIDIEISVLTEPKVIDNIGDFKLSRDGIILTLGYNRSVFLPQVAYETGWDKDKLLSALSIKAGLSADAYKKDDAIFMTFQAEVFS